ncbi:hypothetical protein ABIA39_002730 [Nocardia sp. GAS34]
MQVSAIRSYSTNTDDFEDRGAVQVQDYFRPCIQVVSLCAPDALTELCVVAGPLELLDRCGALGAVRADEEDIDILCQGRPLCRL